jgi:PASTA domain
MPDRWVNPQGWGPPPPPGTEPPAQGTSPAQGPGWGAPTGPPEGWQSPHQQPAGWGSPPPPGPSSSSPWWRRWYVVLAALLAVLGVVALSDDNSPTNDPGQATLAPTTSFSQPTVAATLATTSTAPPTTIEKVVVPRLIGLRLARAKASLADRGLTTKVTYKSTARYPAGTVISQSRTAGAGVLPDTTISLVVAKAPPPPPSTAPPAPPPTAPPQRCHPSYEGECLKVGIGDYDCAGGSGNGPNYVEGTVRVVGPDEFDLDRDSDGLGCEA